MAYKLFAVRVFVTDRDLPLRFISRRLASPHPMEVTSWAASRSQRANVNSRSSEQRQAIMVPATSSGD